MISSIAALAEKQWWLLLKHLPMFMGLGLVIFLSGTKKMLLTPPNIHMEK